MATMIFCRRFTQYLMTRYRSKEIDYTTHDYEESLYNYITEQIQMDQQTSIP